VHGNTGTELNTKFEKFSKD